MGWASYRTLGGALRPEDPMQRPGSPLKSGRGSQGTSRERSVQSSPGRRDTDDDELKAGGSKSEPTHHHCHPEADGERGLGNTTHRAKIKKG